LNQPLWLQLRLGTVIDVPAALAAATVEAKIFPTRASLFAMRIQETKTMEQP
jgi:hypothetical protein